MVLTSLLAGRAEGVDRREQLAGADGLGQAAVHAGFEALLVARLERLGGDADDGDVPAPGVASASCRASPRFRGCPIRGLIFGDGLLQGSLHCSASFAMAWSTSSLSLEPLSRSTRSAASRAELAARCSIVPLSRWASFPAVARSPRPARGFDFGKQPIDVIEINLDHLLEHRRIAEAVFQCGFDVKRGHLGSGVRLVAIHRRRDGIARDAGVDGPEQRAGTRGRLRQVCGKAPPRLLRSTSSCCPKPLNAMAGITLAAYRRSSRSKSWPLPSGRPKSLSMQIKRLLVRRSCYGHCQISGLISTAWPVLGQHHLQHLGRARGLQRARFAAAARGLSRVGRAAAAVGLGPRPAGGGCETSLPGCDLRCSTSIVPPCISSIALTDGQAQPHAAEPPGDRPLALFEGNENPRQRLRTRCRCRYPPLRRARARHRGEAAPGEGTSLGRELHGVAQQVPEDLLQARAASPSIQ